jgi:hypothetical protein
VKPVKRWKTKEGHWVPYTQAPRKKYPFRTPIPPCSVVRVKAAPRSPWREKIGVRFRIGYYSRMDGLDCIWLVNDEGKYQETIDHDYLARFFEVETISKERSWYGRGRPPFPIMN